MAGSILFTTRTSGEEKTGTYWIGKSKLFGLYMLYNNVITIEPKNLVRNERHGCLVVRL